VLGEGDERYGVRPDGVLGDGTDGDAMKELP